MATISRKRQQRSRLNYVASSHPANVYRSELVGIAIEFPKVQAAMSALAAMSIRRKCPRYELVDAFLKLRPLQQIYCVTCFKFGPVDRQLAGRCFDCLLADDPGDPLNA